MNYLCRFGLECKSEKRTSIAAVCVFSGAKLAHEVTITASRCTPQAEEIQLTLSSVTVVGAGAKEAGADHCFRPVGVDAGARTTGRHCSTSGSDGSMAGHGDDDHFRRKSILEGNKLGVLSGEGEKRQFRRCDGAIWLVVGGGGGGTVCCVGRALIGDGGGVDLHSIRAELVFLIFRIVNPAEYKIEMFRTPSSGGKKVKKEVDQRN